jgi:electron transport complex protein RnfD
MNAAAENKNQTPEPKENHQPEPAYHVAPSPHIFNKAISTKWMMYDVVIALIPVVMISVFFFQAHAVRQMLTCTIACLLAEAVFTSMRGRSVTLFDGSAAVTGLILGLSLPWNAPIYVSVIGSVVALGLGKTVFGGLGMNIFNPAMVGRAFVMLSFPAATGASAYINPSSVSNILTQATPLSAAKAQMGTLAPLNRFPQWIIRRNQCVGLFTRWNLPLLPPFCFMGNPC